MGSVDNGQYLHNVETFLLFHTEELLGAKPKSGSRDNSWKLCSAVQENTQDHQGREEKSALALLCGRDVFPEFPPSLSAKVV